jgi:hypothetical protein
MRWIYKNELELLSKIAGFSGYKIYGGFKEKEYSPQNETVVIAEK